LPPIAHLAQHFALLPDPRYRRARRHPLLTLLFIALCGLLSGADNFYAIARWAKAKEHWLQERVDLPGGLPSHHTLSRLFARLDPDAFAACFTAWTQTLHEKTEGEIIALDGKTLRRSFDRATGQPALHLVSAWAAANRLVLSQRKVDKAEAHENEIVALPDLLALLDVRGCLVTIDAAGCQKEIARQIVAQGGDFVLALKENHPHLYDSIAELFTYWRAQEWQTEEHQEPVAHRYAQSVSKGHGRIEQRRCWVVEDVAAWLDPDNQWGSVFSSVAAVECERREKSRRTVQTRYFVTSLTGAGVASQVLRASRLHWGIENRLHWVLDVVFGEDQSRSRKAHGPENLALLRKIALNLLRQERSQKLSLKVKRQLAGWDNDYLETVLTGKPYEPDERS
jgi:predicted transposase YbfD/YdcC